jgi:oligopeptide/dipeptide ABC transporter ATP-binding protein
MTAVAALEVTGLTTIYRSPRGLARTLRRQSAPTVRAVDNVDLSVAAGEIVALVGESGSGKTTLGGSVLGLVTPASGTIRIGGIGTASLSRAETAALRASAQMVFQDPFDSLDPRFSVRRTVAEPLLIHTRSTAQERAARVEQALSQVGLTPPGLFADRLPHELSGGQRQRVAIAAALVLSPRLIIADEPVSMLDVSVRVGVLEVLDTVRATGVGILMITHDLATAASYAQRIDVMYRGRIVESGPAADLVRSPAHPYTRALIAAVPSRIPTTVRPPLPLASRGDVVGPGCAFAGRCPIAVTGCWTSEPERTPLGDGRTVACHHPARVG